MPLTPSLSPSEGERVAEGRVRGPYRVPGYPIVPWVFILFALTFLGFTVYNDFVTYRAALAAGKPALLNCVFGVALVLVGTPIYFFYQRRK